MHLDAERADVRTVAAARSHIGCGQSALVGSGLSAVGSRLWVIGRRLFAIVVLRGAHCWRSCSNCVALPKTKDRIIYASCMRVLVCMCVCMLLCRRFSFTVSLKDPLVRACRMHVCACVCSYACLCVCVGAIFALLMKHMFLLFLHAPIILFLYTYVS